MTYSSCKRCTTTSSQIDGFIGDFEDAWSRTLDLESNIGSDGAPLGNDYLDLLCYATRLAFSSTVLTVGETPDGTLDPTDVMMFMKNAGAAADTCVQIKCSHSDITLNISKIVIVLTP